MCGESQRETERAELPQERDRAIADSLGSKLVKNNQKGVG